VHAPNTGALANSLLRGQISNRQFCRKSSQPHKVSQKADNSYPLALALLRIQFNAMNLAIRPRAAAYGLILTESKLTIGNPFSLLTLS